MGKKWQYLLKNKDKTVLFFEAETKIAQLENLTSEFREIVKAEVINQAFLPYEFLIKKDKNIIDILKDWIKKRKVPNNREFVNNILATFSDKKNDFLTYLDISLALSLNDSFWIIPADSDYQWKNYNLYENSFNEILALVAFAGHSAKVDGITTSPEYTTNGMLKKCWHKNNLNGKIELLKGQTKEYANRGKEAFCEYYMCQIAEVFAFDFVKYDLREFNGEIVTSCELFSSPKYGYIPMANCIKEGINFDNTVELFDAIMAIYGKENFQDLLVFDALICNIDRHLGNFGMLIDNDNNQLIKQAPIFDNGMCFLNLITKDELENIEAALIKNAYYESAFKLNFDAQIKFAANKRHIPTLSKLSDFQFKRHKKYNLAEFWIKSAEKFIQERSKKIIKMIEK
ncbi:MAG: hypothetical protein IJ566_01260 [Cardiobacteriaceae bacterium]|nr:hypothetical protein [Cardiobacteriaceae bacterium]